MFLIVALRGDLEPKTVAEAASALPDVPVQVGVLVTHLLHASLVLGRRPRLSLRLRRSRRNPSRLSRITP